ncbi:hypothetical protein DX130_19395 [Paenibacillus paeoniae]|uniref:Uncharacterized protein n=1 Tax=Paenibacillus paeoniae TaxID=2292705 RepID=A0A371P7L6_9BACL|nr:hypothetical protein DX130_19395 [Paenibacillus paeoniae]
MGTSGFMTSLPPSYTLWATGMFLASGKVFMLCWYSIVNRVFAIGGYIHHDSLHSFALMRGTVDKARLFF